ncbi:hypothetical protein ACNO5M_26460 [Vibrio owensii]|uniref:hypothetical protein n=1 Tax=Vibrio owensii TaxID=696485 RepID=UPI003AB0B86F
MHKSLNHLFALGALSALIASNYAHSAFYINGDVKADGVTWDNVTYGKGSLMVPSKWGVPPALRSVKSWAAGSLPSATLNSFTLKGGLNGETTSAIPVSITGVQYNTTGIDFTEGSNTSGGGCNVDEVSLPLVSVDGIGCISSNELSVSTPTSPFILFRPMFDIDEMDVVNALSGKAEGSYTASVPITVRYYYENTSGISTYRNISDVMIFSFNYEPVEITDLKIIEGDGVMEPEYDATNRKVSAETRYKLQAEGYFNNGIVLTMPNQEYELVNSSEPTVTIPYDVTCESSSVCSQDLLVEEGVLKGQADTYIGEGTGVQTLLPFDLIFDYEVEGEPLVSGDYSDAITIMVSPRI